jgi:glycosyltransferase involved in cell wall biosynthesis
VVACNSDVAHEMENSGAHVHLLPHGVDLERFKPQPFPDFDRLKLLAVGRLVEKKGFHVLLAAVARLQLPFQLEIVGEGPEEDRLMELVRAHSLESNVRFCGPKTHDDLPQLYAQNHILIAPSITDQNGDRDGLPNVILEAMACGRPVIGSDVAAIANAVIPHETGLLTQPGDAPSLAAAIEILATQPSLIQKLGAQAREFVRREYDIHHCAERFYFLLRTTYV